MEKLTIEMFTSVNEDFEKRQYLILAWLQHCQNRFKRNKLYPALAEVSTLYQHLITLKNSIGEMRSDFPKRIKGINLEKAELEYEIVSPGTDNLEQVEKLISWALPYLKETIEEGVAVYDFINENIELDKVGIIPNYQKEGYFFIPDNRKKNLRLYQFEMSIYTAASEKYRTLKTRFLKTLVHNFAEMPPSTIKLDLIAQNRELPNPATYACMTDLDFPFRESIYPVARRQLMRKISEQS